MARKGASRKGNDHDWELDTVRRYMKERGMRWTRPRELIVGQAFGTHEHFTAEQLLEWCQEEDPSVSRATVYRTLATLEEAGFIEGMDTGDGVRRFEHVLGHDHHEHFICLDCDAIVEFTDDKLERMKEDAARRNGFTLESHELKMFVHCDAFQAGRSCPRAQRGHKGSAVGARR